MSRTKAFVASLSAVPVILALAGTGYLWRVAPSGTGYKAMTACTALFISRRSMADLDQEEFAGLHPLLDYVSLSIKEGEKAVTAELLGMGSQKAQFREGLGCTLTDVSGQLPAAPPTLLRPIETRPVEWLRPDPNTLPDKARRAVEAAVNQAFAEPDPSRPRNTRALLVYRDGALIAERYSEGVTAETPLPVYSVTKTVLNALIGIAWAEGRINLDEPVGLSLWRDLPDDDPRRHITANHLLHMTTGTHWSEATGDPLSPILRMTYHERDMAAFAAAQEPEAEPGTVFRYNSGSSVLLSRLLYERLGSDRGRYWTYPREKLFAPLGMSSAIIAPDASGTLNGGFGASATARDWLKFGLLYLNGGMVDGHHILPEDWVKLSYRTQPTSAERGYGKHVWVNRPVKPSDPGSRPRPVLPADTLLMNGQFGQLIAVIPSQRVVIVRLGQSNSWDFSEDPDELVEEILGAVPPLRSDPKAAA